MVALSLDGVLVSDTVVDLRMLDDVAWHELESEGKPERIPALVRELVTLRGEDWKDAFYGELGPMIVNSGTCYAATAAIVPAYAVLATSMSLPAEQRFHLHGYLALMAGFRNNDLVIFARDGQDPHPLPWDDEVYHAARGIMPDLLSKWSLQSPAVKFYLAVLASVFPDVGRNIYSDVVRFAEEFKGTRPGTCLDLAVALIEQNEQAVAGAVQGIAGWYEVDDWSTVSNVPYSILYADLLRQIAVLHMNILDPDDPV